MKKVLCLIWFAFSLYSSLAQDIQYKPIPPMSPAPPAILQFEGVRFSSIDVADIDNDNDLDVILAGRSNQNESIIKLYLNDGNNNYLEAGNSSFTPRIRAGAVVFADMDNDSDPDLLISGIYDPTSLDTAQLYENDGYGNFTLLSSTTIQGGPNSSAVFSDLNNDGYADLFLINGNGTFFYLNYGGFNFISNGLFSAIATGSLGGALALSDVDGDNDLDLLLSGTKFVSGPNDTKHIDLYTNDGNGNFNRKTYFPLPPVAASKLTFGDIDSDGDMDLIVVGDEFNKYTKVFSNNGFGGFTLMAQPALPPLGGGSQCRLGDMDGDGDLDLVISGTLEPIQYDLVGKLFENDGLGNFSEVLGSEFMGTDDGALIIEDFDNDSDYDILVSGYTRTLAHPTSITKLYMNQGNFTFSEVTGTAFNRHLKAKVYFEDMDYDYDLDVLVVGNYGTEKYLNDGSGNYILSPDTVLVNIQDGTAAFSDFDNDNDNDLIISGESTTSGQGSMKLYKNDGAGNFTPSWSSGLEGFAIAVADVDGDLDQDIAVSMLYPNGGLANNNTLILLNTGSGTFFNTATGIPFTTLSATSLNFFDADNDGDPDLLLSGSRFSSFYTNLYLNDGSGLFTKKPDTVLTPMEGYGVACADIDGDNDIDILMTGVVGGGSPPQGASILYKNDGAANFTKMSGTSIPDVYYGSVDFGDIDNDNDVDLIVTGNTLHNRGVTNLYINDGLGNFSQKLKGTNFDQIYNYTSVGFGDIDSDNDQDILIAGKNETHEDIIKLYRNVSCHQANENDSIYSLGPYTWPLNKLTYSKSGAYHDTIKSAVGCDTSAVLNLTVKGLGINQSFGVAKIELYPNPTSSGFISINLGTEESNTAKVTVYNSVGSLLDKRVFRNVNEASLQLPAEIGIYFILVSTNLGATKSFKIIKE